MSFGRKHEQLLADTLPRNDLGVSVQDLSRTVAEVVDGQVRKHCGFKSRVAG